MSSIKKRGVHRQVFTRLHNGILALLGADVADVNVIIAKFQVLEKKYDELTSLNNVISGELCESTDDKHFEQVMVAEMDSCVQYDEMFHTIRLKVNTLLNPPPSVAGASVKSDNSVDRKTKMKFPKIEFRPFSGDVSQWIGFWSQFKTVHLDNSFSDEEKFQYLIQTTKVGSKARALVDSFPPSGDNYEKAINQLKSRFGRDELLIEHYVRELLNLVLLHANSKSPLTLTQLSDRLETQLLALESLGVTSEKYACMLYPLVESALPEEVLRDWERHRKAVNRGSVVGDSSLSDADGMMDQLRAFLRSEVESDERVSATRKTFKPSTESAPTKLSFKKSDRNPKVATATDLISIGSSEKRLSSCVFCNSLDHPSEFCPKARTMTPDDRFNILKSKKLCFRCLAPFHGKRRCGKEVRCFICTKGHCSSMCRGPDGEKKLEEQSSPAPNKSVEHSYSNLNCAPVLMQTLKVQVKGDVPVTARLMIDTGSQHSYITRRLADKMKYESVGKENLVHALFGGATTKVIAHQCYRIRLQSLTSEFSCNFQALDSENICHAVPAIPKGPWLSELKQLNIPITDTEQGAVDILVGADVAGRLFTGKRHVLSCGLVALETSLGWTIMGRLRQDPSDYMLNVTSLCSVDLSPSEIWRLDVIGINDPADVSTQEEARSEARMHFLSTVNILNDGRYEVSLPWLEGHKPLPRGYEMAMSRLETTVRRLHVTGLFEAYESVLMEWINEGIIEEVPIDNWDRGHYLPHRAVLKEGSTTRIRPVFDASAHERGQPNLNQCLEKGENLIELIPAVLLRFRQNQIGVISDIRKAFLQISVCEADRDYLRFLWRDSAGQLKIFRHKRVVFGVTSSPFLLGAVIDHHLTICEHKAEMGMVPYDLSVIDRLRHSLYVDNCVTSVDNPEEMEVFVTRAKQIFQEACFDLRGWEWSDPTLLSSTKTPVLGILWDRKYDVLSLNPPNFENIKENQITRRTVQSASQRVFDPLGVLSPTTLIPRLIIQESWINGGTWDSPLEEEKKKVFLQWISEATALNEIEVPRWVRTSDSMVLHTFCDASQKAFAAVSFLRVEIEEQVFVTLIAAKTRVAPIKRVTIPRLELLAATIGARLAASVLKELGPIGCYFWSDSTTALSWIRREEPWGVFVYNRVREIRKLTRLEDWHHISGTQNPADLASRGCNPFVFSETRWWEGPDWLYSPPSQWSTSESAPDEDVILQERRKMAVATVNCPVQLNTAQFNKFSQYSRVVKVAGWMIRYLLNKYSRHGNCEKKLSLAEVDRAERLILRMVQEESFKSVNDVALRKLKPHTDKHGLIRLRTRIWARKDSEDFRSPIILPSNHSIVSKLIMEFHRRNGHVLGQNLLNLLRERFWILKGRQSIKKVIIECTVCQRFRARSLEVESPPLPENRVRDANVFEVIGTDLAGPLYLDNGNKVWICLFTCAVYRAVHLELVSSQSTEAFLLAFRRFVALRGRPSVVYSDNGRNFRGTDNALKEVDWGQVAAEGAIDKIDWRFNPPRAAWWGGFWERMVGVLKVILRKILGRASLNYEELSTLIYECATYVNRRPITYQSEDPCDPVPIMPQMFLQETPTNGVPDLDAVDAATLKRRLQRRLKLKEELRNRFRSEYLGQLHLATGGFKDKRAPVIGEVVLIGSSEDKRMDWPLAVIEEQIIGNDGKCRAVKLRTGNGHLTRAIQHIFPLEIFPVDAEETTEQEDHDLPRSSLEDQEDPRDVEPRRKKTVVQKCVLKDSKTRCGRKVRLPVRYAI